MQWSTLTLGGTSYWIGSGAAMLLISVLLFLTNVWPGEKSPKEEKETKKTAANQFEELFEEFFTGEKDV